MDKGSILQRCGYRFFLFFLYPLSWVWVFLALLVRYGMWRRRKRSVFRVVSVGNLVMGGSGKTPLIEVLFRRLSSSYRCVVLSRGYRGEACLEWLERGKELEGRDLVRRVGDEVSLHWSCGVGPILVAKDKAYGLEWLERHKGGEYDCVLVEDGFQSHALMKDVEVVLIPVDLRWEECYCPPLGILREPFYVLREADFVLLTGSRQREEDFIRWEKVLGSFFPHLSLFRAYRRIEVEEKEGRYCLFTSIARPQRLVEDLMGLGVSVCGVRFFPDHYLFKKQDVERLRSWAGEVGAKLLCSQKDWVKVEGFLSSKDCGVVRVGYEVDDVFFHLLEKRVVG